MKHRAHTVKNDEHTVFPQTWLIPEQSGLQYGLNSKFLLFKTQSNCWTATLSLQSRWHWVPSQRCSSAELSRL